MADPHVREACIPVLYGEPSLAEECARKLGLEDLLPRRIRAPMPGLREAAMVAVPATGLESFAPGRPDAATGRIAFACIDRAIEDALARRVAGGGDRPRQQEGAPRGRSPLSGAHRDLRHPHQGGELVHDAVLPGAGLQLRHGPCGVRRGAQPAELRAGAGGDPAHRPGPGADPRAGGDAAGALRAQSPCRRARAVRPGRGGADPGPGGGAGRQGGLPGGGPARSRLRLHACAQGADRRLHLPLPRSGAHPDQGPGLRPGGQPDPGAADRPDQRRSRDALDIAWKGEASPSSLCQALRLAARLATSR